MVPIFHNFQRNFQSVPAELSLVVKYFAILKGWKPIKHQMSNYRQRENTIAYTSTKSEQSFNPKLHASLSILFFHSWNYLMIQLRYIESISLSLEHDFPFFFPPYFFLLFFSISWHVIRSFREFRGRGRERERDLNRNSWWQMREKFGIVNE